MNPSISDVVTAAFEQLGISPPPETLLHTFALAEGRLVAHKFRYEGGYAVWLVGSNRVDCYDASGSLLQSVGLDVAGRRTAA